MKNEYGNIYKNVRYTLILTDTANKKIKQIICDDSTIFGLRIDIKKIGCAGYSYAFSKVNKKNFDHTDLIFKDSDHTKIFIPFKIVSIINKSELDYVQNDLHHTFKFKNPNVRNLCGCGESFNI